MTSYSVSCGVHATDNDHLKLAELRVPGAQIALFVTGLRALLTGHIDRLYLCDVRQKAVITAADTAFTLLFENGSSARLSETQVCEMEDFALARLCGHKKPNTCLTLQLAGADDMQLSFSLWIGMRTQ